jgi:hypothetical protein
MELLTGTYSFRRIMLSIAGVPVVGFGEGDALTVEYDADLFTDKCGAGGSVVRGQLQDNRATIKIKLMQTSPAITAIEGLLRSDQLTGKGAFPVSLVDLNSGTTHASPTSWMKKRPNRTFGTDPSELEYEIRCANLEGVNIPIIGTPAG